MRLRFAALAAACLSCVVAVDALAEECRAPTVTFQAPALLTGLVTNEAKRPLRIVAVGSSSTQGVGASGPSRTYPAQLALALADRLPGASLDVGDDGVRVRLRTELLGQPVEAVATGRLGASRGAIERELGKVIVGQREATSQLLTAAALTSTQSIDCFSAWAALPVLMYWSA